MIDTLRFDLRCILQDFWADEKTKHGGLIFPFSFSACVKG